MCGFFGFSGGQGDLVAAAQKMVSSISHRGPDGHDIWLDEAQLLVLGHTRLAIQDLSPAGAQPMSSRCGRFVIAFNGEIYNHLEIRQELERSGYKIAWRGHSDTETLLECLSIWGAEKTLNVLVGMFAFAFLNIDQKSLILARDRFGEKPLYWGWSGDLLIFGSELKAIKAHPEFEAIIDRDALGLYMRHCYVPAPYSIYCGISKLLPGHFVEISLDKNCTDSKLVRSSEYWSVDAVVRGSAENHFKGSEKEAIEKLEKALRVSVSGQLLADVEVGAFLSGGIDSTLIAALMQSESEQKMRSFTIGFDVPGYNEAPDAKKIARHLGLNHSELYVTAKDALAVIPNLPNIYCEPFSDSSQIPTFLVSQMAREHIKVALSGDGGDELFGGYNRYLSVNQFWRRSQRAPEFARKLIARGLDTVSPMGWDRAFNGINRVLPKNLKVNIAGEKARKISDTLRLSDDFAFYRQLTSHWVDPAQVVINSSEPYPKCVKPALWDEASCLEHAMMAADAKTYLSDDILTKVDRAAMANSLETRVPFLDHKVFEFAWSLPLDYKIRNGQGKWILRQILYQYVPKKLFERPKAGFGIPLDEWLRGPLRDWAEALLDEKRLEREGYFYAEHVRLKWREHLSGQKNWQYHLWSVLMFQAWLEKN